MPGHASTETLSPGHVEALQHVDTILAVGHHGYDADFGHGPAVLGVQPRSYDRVIPLVDELRDGQGMLGMEAIGFDEPWTSQVTRSGVLAVADASPYLMTPDAGSPTYEADLAAVVERAAALQIIGPTQYAEARATLEGVPIRFTDANKEEMAQWRAEAGEGERDTEFRNGRILFGLGEAAVQLLDQPRATRPPLIFMGGSNHLKGVRQEMRRHDIQPRVVRYSRPRPIRDAVGHATVRAHMNYPEIPPAPVQLHRRAWKNNLAKQLG